MVGAAFGLYSTARQDAAARANAALTAMEVRAATERAERMLNELNETRIELQPSTKANEELRATLEKNGTQTNPPNPSLEFCARFDSRESISCPNAKTADRHYAGPNVRRVGQRPWRVGVPAKLILGECDSVFKCGRYSRREV